MPRDLALGNGRLLVTFDSTYTLRDVYYPHVGKEDHTIGHPCRVGIWVDGCFSWFSDEGWARSIRYRADTLVSDVVLEHADLGLRIHAADAVYPTQSILLRSFAVTNLAGHPREVRLFFHHDFHILESGIGDTAYFEPVNRFLIQDLIPSWYFGLIGLVALRNVARARGCRFPHLEKAVARLAPRPLLMIHGGADTYIKPEMAQALFALAGEPRELWLVDGAKHNQALQVANGEYKRKILEFFQRHLGDGAPLTQPALSPAGVLNRAACGLATASG